MRRCLGTIYVKEDNYEAIISYYYQNHSKSISQAIDQVFTHYYALIEQNNKHIEEIKKLKEQLNVLNTVIIQYREQIIKPIHTIQPTTTSTSSSSSSNEGV